MQGEDWQEGRTFGQRKAKTGKKEERLDNARRARTARLQDLKLVDVHQCYVSWNRWKEKVEYCSFLFVPCFGSLSRRMSQISCRCGR